MVQQVWLEEEKPVSPPEGLAPLLTDLATAAIKEQPGDLLEFGLAFFLRLKKEREEREALKHAPPLKVIISGAPASGKGTQAARIVAEHGLVHISVGDLLRAEVAAGSELGVQARGFMDSCGLVPDDLAAQLVRTRLGQKDAQQHGWLLDGYPRTAAQAEALAAAGVRPDVVLCLEVPDDVLMDRVAGRRLDPQTGDIWHLAFKPPPPEIAHRLVQRADDTEGTVRQRLTNYKLHCQVVKSAPGLVAHLVEVDGDRPEEAVAEDIHAALAAARSAAGAATQAAGGSWAAVGSG